MHSMGQVETGGIQSLLSASSTQPVYLIAVQVEGGQAFSDEFYKKLLTPLLAGSDYTLARLTAETTTSYHHLLDTGVFDEVKVRVQPDYYSTAPSVKSYNHEKSIPAKVTFDVSPTPLNTSQGFLKFDAEDFLNLQLNHVDSNFNGNGEVVSVGVDYNPYKPHDHLLSQFKFASSLKDPRFKVVLDGGYNTKDNHAWSDFQENELGGKIGIQYKAPGPWSVFAGLSLFKRNLYDIDDSASDNLKFFGGQFLKSSVAGRVCYKNVSCLGKVFPTDGIEVEADAELSSVQEQANPSNSGEFAKSKVRLGLYKSFLNITTSFTGEVGGIYNFNSKFPVHTLDKFYLGGHSSFVGFKQNSVEPSGGLSFYKLQATMLTKVPRLFYAPPHNVEPTSPLRLYCTALLGNVDSKFSLTDSTAALSYGAGLKYFNQWANFDLGYYFSKRSGGDESAGVQFSISIGACNHR
ncbi:uncharacterized protein LODBEIA_P57000 [Lodderomyces beijingensis]|uniref:Bacterial surface antigen (D15) domain-containing protein n=1 Tax=Lodderomyces beijingensis TaxID=1775926 RepID=A0ABP0ZQP6_9ASCO